jgi:tetratricopeptide (TPR) repeat protein
VKLFQRLPGADELLELSAAAITRRPFDLHIPLLSLPGLFGTTVDTVPANLPFIAPEPAKVSGWRQRLGSNTVNIGIVWAGSAWHHNDGQRSCPLSLFLPLARMPVIRLVALQKGEAAKAVDRLLEGVPFVNAGPELQDFSDTADLVAALDLVITVDTAAAHLAATMETPTWVVVPFPADWRWMLGREDSPWYPTLRLFRQTRRGCWQEVFTAVERALREFIAKRRARPAETLLRPGAPDSRDSSHAERPGNMTKSAPHPTDPSSPERAPAATIPSDPNVPFAWLDAAEACEARNRIPEAIDCYRRALALDPTLADGHYHLGNLYLDQKRFSEAVACFDQALKARPEFPEAFFNHGVALLGLNRLPEADACFREAVRLKPDMTAAHYNLGFSLQKQSRWREAVASLQRAVAIDNRFAQAWNNMGTCFQELGRRVDAMSNCRQAAACYQKALECDTQDAAVFCNNLGKLHQDLHDIPAAISWYRRAIARRPEYAEAYFNLATAQLLAGSFAEGWTNYEWRLRRGDWQRFYPRRFTLPRWDGFPFKGRTLWVHTEQGLGDTLQFVRYLPQVKALGGKVVFETRRTFFDLFYKLPGVDRLVEMGPASDPESEADLYVPLASLPGIFKSDLGSIPADVPYLAAPADRLQRWGKRLAGSELRVGLVWAGSVVDPNRSLPLAWFAPLTRIPGTRWYGLQKGAAADQALAEGLPPGMDLSLIGVEFEDFGDTAAAAACLDLILSIDTSVAHLSGALAKPTYLLLDYCSDWRWLLEREESPWYPTMRLFRQQRPGDWSAPLTRVGRELETLSANLAKALTVEGAAGLVAGIDFYRRQGRAVEALVFAERLRRRSA